jgi:hypothetical protein
MQVLEYKRKNKMFAAAKLRPERRSHPETARGALVLTCLRYLDAPRNRETGMAIDGNWEITINSPMGAQKAKLELAANGNSLTGTQHAQGASQPLANGKVDGDKVSWSANITSPMPMTLEFSGSVEGDSIKGSVKAGAFGSFPFSGARA